MVLRLYLILRVKTHLTSLRIDGWGIGEGRGLRQVPPAPASGSGLHLNYPKDSCVAMGPSLEAWVSKY